MAHAADQTLLLAVRVNGYPIDKIGEFVSRDGALLARRAELRELGFRVPAGGGDDPDGLIPLADLGGVTWRLDQGAQTIHAAAASARLLPAILPVGPAVRAAARVESGTGVTLNYDVSGTFAGGQNVGSGFFDLRAFSNWGVLSTGALGYAGGGPAGPGTSSAIRLDSVYTFSDPEALRRYRLGDFITGSLGWTRPFRLGGGQITSDFSLRPDLVTFPLPSVSGIAAVPSTVDVMINSTRLFSRQIGAGPFEIPQLPVVTGAGTVSMTLTNALGRQVAVTLPFYASAALLAPGLQTFSAQAGSVRRNWSVVSDDYRDLAGIATYRRGLLPFLTVEASAEGSPGAFMAGGGFAVNVANLAVFNLTAAASTGSALPGAAPRAAGGTGSQINIGFQRIGPRISVGASASFATRSFRDVAAMNGDPVPRRRLNANVGLSLGAYGSVGLAYASVVRDVAPTAFRVYVPPGSSLAEETSLVGGVSYFQPAQRAHVLSASYSVQVWGASVYATGFRDFASGGNSGLLFGVTMPFGQRSSASASVGSGSGGAYGQLQAARSPVTIGDWGYQTVASIGDATHAFGQAQYKSPWALLTAGADWSGRQATGRLEAQGAVSYVDGTVFASNAIPDSFAVVNTDGVPGVRVLQENRLVGRTDADGRLLVPDLRSFDINRIAIEPNDIPPDATIGFTTREVRPQDRSAVVVRFPVQVSRGALLRLVDQAGAPIPVGSTATLLSTGAIVPVGFDGNAYVQDLDRRNEVAVERPDGRRCRVVFEYTALPGDIPTIGPLGCEEQRP